MTEKSVFQIAVPLSQNWRDIELLRTSVLNCLAAVFHESEFCTTIGMITGELLENALKFGDWSDPQKPFRLHVFGDPGSVMIEVSNPVQAQHTNVKKLLDMVRRINSAPNRSQIFLERLAELAAQPAEIAAHAGGLGLARIAYEANCELSASCEDGFISVRTVTRP